MSFQWLTTDASLTDVVSDITTPMLPTIYESFGFFSFPWDMALINKDDFWLLRMLLILVGYSTVLIPGYFFVRYIKQKTKEEDFGRRGPLWNFVRQFAVGQPEYSLVSGDSSSLRSSNTQPIAHNCLMLITYAMGIQVTLVSMGFFQERIMTLGYPRSDDVGLLEQFGDAQFLVFANRIIALLLVGIYLFINWRKMPPHVPPLYTHSFISISNTISSWCQYEALKFVSFPTQTVFKAAKVVPTMIMGRILRGEHRPKSDYLMGASLATGAALFFLSTQNTSGDREVYFGGIFSGVILMVGYLFFDAFTLNWQKKLFDTKPKISRYQMMLGVNGFSAILCLVSLLEQGTLFSSFTFLCTHLGISSDVFLLSLSNAVGQFFIYLTIERFGPVVFAIIMTVRQILSIILSTVYFSHGITILGVFGLTLAFGSLMVDGYVRYLRSSK